MWAICLMGKNIIAVSFGVLHYRKVIELLPVTYLYYNHER